MLVKATFRLETGNGTSALWLNSNNAGGIKCGLEYCTYSSKEEGMKALREILNWYVKKYGFDYKAIRNEYCQCGGDDHRKFIEILEEERKKHGKTRIKCK